MTFLKILYFPFFIMDFLSFISNLFVINKLKALIIKILKNQVLIIFISFIICYFYLKIDSITAFNVSQTSLSKSLFGITSESILLHCNSNTELLGFGLMFIGTYLTYCYFFNPFILKPAYSYINETSKFNSIEEVAIISIKKEYLEAITLMYKNLRENKDSNLTKLPIFFKKNPELEVYYGQILSKGGELHTKLLPNINSECCTNFNEFTNGPLYGVNNITTSIVSKLHGNELKDLALMHITSVISERLIQLSEDNKDYPLNVPFLLPNKQTKIVDVPATYTSIWEYYIVPGLHYIGSFF